MLGGESELGLGGLGHHGAECRGEFVYVIVVRRPDLLPKHLIVTQTGESGGWPR